MTANPLNRGLLEIARILLEFEISRIERQTKTAANGETREDNPKATVAIPSQPKLTRHGHSTEAGALVKHRMNIQATLEDCP